MYLAGIALQLYGRLHTTLDGRTERRHPGPHLAARRGLQKVLLPPATENEYSFDVLTPLAQSVTADACSDTCPVAARRQLIHFAVEYLFQDTLFQDTFVNLKFNSDDDAKQYLATCIDRQTTCIDSFNKAKLLFESSSQKCDYSAIQDTIGALGFVLQCQCSKEAMDQVLESLYSGPLGFDMADFELAFGKRDNALLLNAR